MKKNCLFLTVFLITFASFLLTANSLPEKMEVDEEALVTIDEKSPSNVDDGIFSFMEDEDDTDDEEDDYEPIIPDLFCS